jgi:NAD(P)-dependent dehydrogenase (short-subunit alcohol dehydrogenase family)
MALANPFSLENKTILITGASSGIGQAAAIECSKMGAAVIITAGNEERPQKTFAQLEGDGHSKTSADLMLSAICPKHNLRIMRWIN